jgi:heat-inducible transcriptional repressor
VQNRILITGSHAAFELIEAANILNQHYGDDLRGNPQTHTRAETAHRGHDAPHDGGARCGQRRVERPAEAVVISGEGNLLDSLDLASNMSNLRRLFDLFERKTGLLQLLDNSNRAEGVQIFIGGESGVATLDECSVVTAPYTVEGEVVGTVGVIGPTRMAYERVIPIVDITARLLSSALGK